MSVTETNLFDPPVRARVLDESGLMSVGLRNWLFSEQMRHPLVVVDTSGGNISQAAPPAGLANSTGQSNQNQEITYVKSSSDANTFTLTGVEGGSIVISTQFAHFKIKSDGTNWWRVA